MILFTDPWSALTARRNVCVVDIRVANRMTADADSGNAPRNTISRFIRVSWRNQATPQATSQLPPPLSEPLLHPTEKRDINNFPREECRYENKMVGVPQAADDVRIITYLPPLLVATSDQGAKEVLVNWMEHSPREANSRLKYLNSVNCSNSKSTPYDLMFFWPCIMNWLYINYQFLYTDYYLFIKY